MGLYLWDQSIYFKKQPSLKLITRFGEKRWDSTTESLPANTLAIKDRKTIFTMPSFGRHGRWGNMVFQYLFIRVLALNNDGEIELYREGEYLESRMSLYQDMTVITPLQTRANIFLLDSYQLFIRSLNYIPGNFWRAMYVSNIRSQKCYFIKDTALTINQPLPFPKGESIELEGLFMFNPKLYKEKKGFITGELFKPNAWLSGLIQQLGQDNTIIGIHIRKGDFVFDPLQQSFQFPIPVKYITNWLTANIASFKNPVIVVCSDDDNACKEIERAGFEVFTSKNLLGAEEAMANLEQLDWEILRRCNVLLGSNSSFSFSAAILALNDPQCYRFSLTENAFIVYDPWESEPLQHFTSSPYLWGYLNSRFNFVLNMVNTRQAARRLYKDTRNWIGWKMTKPFCLYYAHGFSTKLFGGLLNVAEFFKLNHSKENEVNYNSFEELSNL